MDARECRRTGRVMILRSSDGIHDLRLHFCAVTHDRIARGASLVRPLQELQVVAEDQRGGPALADRDLLGWKSHRWFLEHGKSGDSPLNRIEPCTGPTSNSVEICLQLW